MLFRKVRSSRHPAPSSGGQLPRSTKALPMEGKGAALTRSQPDKAGLRLRLGSHTGFSPTGIGRRK